MSAPLALPTAIKVRPWVALALGALALLSLHTPANAGANGSPALARDGSNALLPNARKNLDTGLVNVKDYGAVGDAQRLLCPVTSTAGSAAVTVGSPCSFVTADIGKPIVLFLENSGTATSPLATTIAARGGANSLTLGDNAGQTLAPSFVGDTHSSTTIDNIASTAGLKAGMTVTGADLAANTYLAAVAANSVTLSAAATGSHATQTIATATWVSWGTDNATAIANAYAQAAKQVSATGQQGMVYFPPATATSGGVESHRFYGTTAAVGVAPNGYRIATIGAGPYKSVVLALAAIASSTSGLLLESSAYADGNVVRDIGFDGNMLAANVGYLACSPNSRLDNVAFWTPAPAGTNLKVGASGSGNCPGLIATAARTDSSLALLAAQYPDKHIDINSTDTQWHGALTNGPAATYGIHVESTAANTAMLMPHTSTLTGGTVIQVDAAITYLDDPQVDNGGVGTITGITVNANSVKIVAGRHNLPAAASVGINVAAGKAGVTILGFDCNRFTTAANCITTTTLGAGTHILASGTSTVTPQYAQVLNQFPTGTTNTTGVLMGLGLAITPKTTGFINAAYMTNATNTVANSGVNVSVKYGTGTAPANGADCTTPGGGATTLGGGNPRKTASATAGAVKAVSGDFAISPLTVGTAYWFDLCVAAITSGTAALQNADLKATEVSR